MRFVHLFPDTAIGHRGKPGGLSLWGGCFVTDSAVDERPPAPQEWRHGTSLWKRHWARRQSPARSAPPALPLRGESGLGLSSGVTTFPLLDSNVRSPWFCLGRATGRPVARPRIGVRPDVAGRRWRPRCRGSRCSTGQTRSERSAPPTLRLRVFGFRVRLSFCFTTFLFWI